MRSNRRRNTKPELAVRKLLHEHGYRYRVDFAPLPTQKRRRADIVFTRWQLVLFIDGCFWHGCPTHATIPATNHEFWEGKLSRNKARDVETTTALESAGWTVMRFWEHEPAAEVAAAVIQRLRLLSKDG